MESSSFLAALGTDATIAEIPGFGESLEIDARARDLADLLRARPELPGVLLTRKGRLESAISRRYYLDAVGRYLGMDLYLPRPIELMMSRFEELGGALVVDGELPIPEAVRRGLGRRSELAFEPIVVRMGGRGGEARLIDFGQLLLADSQVALVRSRQMRQILTTVTDGLLLVGRDRTVSAEYSAATEALLDLDRIAGVRFDALLAEGLDGERAALGSDYLASLFDPRVIESLVVKINPLQRVVWRRSGARPRVLDFRFARGVEEGEIRRVLVRIEDVTRAEELAAEVERERERAESRMTLAVAAVQIEPELLDAFLAAVERQRLRLIEAARGGAVGDEQVDALFRRVHALKGEAGLLGLSSFQTALHRVEEELEAAKRDRDGARDGLVVRATALGELTAEVRELLARISGHARVRRAATPATGSPVDVAVPGTTRAQELVEQLDRLAQRIAGDTGRAVTLVAEVDPAALAPHEPLLREALAQLVRNAVVHGVEPIELRLAAGKEPAGTIQIALRTIEAGDWIEAVVQDDGRGIDWDAVRDRAGGAALDQAGLVELLFRPGFSTAAEASEHAGRGVGLDLVRDRVEAAGGVVEVHTEAGSYTAFRIVLPARLPATRGGGEA